MSYTLTSMDWLLTTDPDYMAEAEEYANQLYQDGYCIEHEEEFDPEADNGRGCLQCEQENMQNELLTQYWSDVK